MSDRLLYLELDDGANLSEIELRAMWNLRDSLMRLKPDRDRHEAWLGFCSTVTASPTVGRLLARDGRVLAMLTFRLADTDFEGRPVHLLLGGYGFVAREIRSHPLVMVMYVLTIARGMRLGRGERQFVCAIGYPVSAVRLAMGGGLILPGLADLSPLERYVLDETRRHLAPNSWDDARGAVDMETIPEPLSERWLAKYRDDPTFRHYRRQLPTWHEGYGLPMAVRIDPLRFFVLTSVSILRRGWRKLRGRSNLHAAC